MTLPFGRVPDESPMAEAWEEEGRRVGEHLDGVNLILVLGLDHRDTALAALGIGRAQAGKRRVAIGDLLGDAAPLQRLMGHDDQDHHGLVDSFLYGVSINKIARPIEGAGELYVLPSGSETPKYDEIFTHPRWRRLASGFHETGALLVIAAPADAPHLRDVAAFADGVVMVGDAELPRDDATLLGRVKVAEPQPALRASVNADNRELEVTSPSIVEPRVRSSVRPAALAGIGLAVVLAAVGLWLAARPLARHRAPRRSTSTAAGALPNALDSSVRPDSAATAAATTAAQLMPANPADSAAAAAYAVAAMTMNTQAGAILWFQNAGRALPAATFAPVLVQGAPWFRVLVGAYANRAQADSLLGALRARNEVPSGLGEVVHAPYAFLVDSVSAGAVAGLLKYFADRGQPVYALRQADGSARLYAGAFETREQATLFVDAIRASGIRPVLVYRIGRVN